MSGSSFRRLVCLKVSVLSLALPAFGLLAQPVCAVAAGQPAVTSGSLDPMSIPTAAPSDDATAARGRHHHRAARSTPVIPIDSPAPAPSATSYTNVTGTWEVVFQPGHDTLYSYFSFAPSDTGAFEGRWIKGTTSTHVVGQLEGDRFKIVGEDAKGRFLMTGYEEATATMIGVFQQGSSRTPFTATHQGSSTGPNVHAHRRRRHHGSTAGSND